MLDLIFLLFFGIVMFAVAKQSLPDYKEYVISLMVLVGVCVWILYDFVKLKIDMDKKVIRDAEQRAVKASCGLQKELDEPKKPVVQVQDAVVKLPPTKQDNMSQRSNVNNMYNVDYDNLTTVNKSSAGEFDIDIFNGSDLRKIHKQMGCDADTQIFNRNKYSSEQSKQNKVNNASWNKYSFQPFIEEELREHSVREWWTSDHLDIDF